MNQRRVSIIGTSKNINSKELFNSILNDARSKVNSNDILVSGGAAGADHIAVRLFLENHVSELELHLPCRWNDGKYFDSGEYDWRVNPGKTSNTYHRIFSLSIHSNSLNELNQAIINGAKIFTYNGFHSRNNSVAECDSLLAYSFDLSGGTLDTWKKCSSEKEFINLKRFIK
jgi:hypothetical protein